MLIPDLAELMSRKEDLHPELAECLTDGALGRMIHNRYIIEPIYHEQMNALTNARYVAKKLAAEEALAQGNASRFVYLNERPYRFEAFMEAIAARAVDEEETFNTLLSSVWMDSENIHAYVEEWKSVWKLSNPALIMSDEDRVIFDSLPATITIYRGLDNVTGTLEGMSWTVSKERAKWFAKRFSAVEPVIASVTIAKDKIYAYLGGRNEEEIVVNPDDLEDIIVEDL
jgi:hypothetical protein